MYDLDTFHRDIILKVNFETHMGNAPLVSGTMLAPRLTLDSLSDLNIVGHTFEAKG